MDQQVREQLLVLFENLSVYYVDEKRILLDRIKNIHEEIKYISNISRTSDIYNIAILIEEIRLITTYSFNERLGMSSKKINLFLDDLLETSNTHNLEKSLKQLNSYLIEYKQEVESFFQERLDLLDTTSDVKEFITNIKKPNHKLNDKLFSKSFRLKELYMQQIKGEYESELLANSYKNFFLKAKDFVKNNTLTNAQLPLDSNPIVSLLRLSYVIYTKQASMKYICDGDLIILNAFSQSSQDKEIISLIEQISNNSLVQAKYNNLKEALDDDIKVKQAFDYGAFSVSQYFFDFNITDLFQLTSKDQSIEGEKTEQTFSTLMEELKLLPEMLLTKDELLVKLKKRKNLYETFTENVSSHKGLSLPKEILQKLTNLYFYNNIKAATCINYAISSDNNYVTYKFSEFESIYKNITDFVTQYDSKSKDTLKRYLQHVTPFICELDDFYESCFKKEKQISNTIYKEKEGAAILDSILKKYAAKSYKEIISDTNSTEKQESINQELSKLKKMIMSKDIDQASIKFTNLTLLLLDKGYYNCPTLLSFRELPPISHAIATLLEKESSSGLSPAVSDIIELNEGYWRV